MRKATQRLITYWENKGYVSNPRRFLPRIFFPVAHKVTQELKKGFILGIIIHSLRTFDNFCT